jgi:hypothetical protein
MKTLVVLPESNSFHTVQSELSSRLQNAVGRLRIESETVHANMERALFRLMTQREGVNLDGLGVGKWSEIAAEVTAIQEALQGLEDVG